MTTTADADTRVRDAITQLSTPRRRRIEYEIERGEQTNADSVPGFVRAAAAEHVDGDLATATVDDIIHATGMALVAIDRAVARDVSVPVDVPPELFVRAWLRYRAQLVREGSAPGDRDPAGALEDYLYDYLLVSPEFTIDGRLPDAVSLLTAGDDALAAQSVADSDDADDPTPTPATTSEPATPAAEGGGGTVDETPPETIRERHAEAPPDGDVPVTVALSSTLLEAADRARDCDAGETVPQWLARAAREQLRARDDVPAHLLEALPDDDRERGAGETTPAER